MTKATLIDSFYASYHNEMMNFVADCADHPYHHSPQTNQEREVVVLSRKEILFPFKQNGWLKTSEFQLAIHACVKRLLQNYVITICDVTSQITVFSTI